MLTASLKRNGSFVTEMVERRASFRRAPKTLAARLVLPFELRWWYWLEYGTATYGDPEHGASGHEYEIRPRNAVALRWPDQFGKYSGGVPNPDGFAYFEVVSHPGIRPRHFVMNAEPFIIDNAGKMFHEFFRQGHLIRPDAIRRLLVSKIIPMAIDEISFSMGLDLHKNGLRGDKGAKLKGQLATDVFKHEAKAVDTSQ